MSESKTLFRELIENPNCRCSCHNEKIQPRLVTWFSHGCMGCKERHTGVLTATPV